MPNLATALKDEIRRLARKEIRKATGSTKQAVAKHRRDIALLKRQIESQQKEIAALKTREGRRAGQESVVEEPTDRSRFSARSVRSQRKRLKLSAEEFSRLIGVTPLTVYNWEHGRSRPRKAQMASLVAVRRIGRRAAVAQLDSLNGKKKKA